jgi:hypothetical protein
MLAGVGGAIGAVNLPASITSNDGPIVLENDGDWTAAGANGEWVTPSELGVAALYEARAFNLAGNTAQAVGTFNTFLDLATTRSWNVNAGGFLITFTLEIRDKATHVVRDSAACTISSS